MMPLVSRRRFLTWFGVGAGLQIGGILLSACAGQTGAPTAAPTPAATTAAPIQPTATPPGITPSPATAAATATTGPVATTAPTTQPVTLEIFTAAGSQWAEWMNKAYKDDVDGWRTKHPNITPHVNGVPGWTAAYFPKVFSLVSTGAKFDILWYPPTHRSHLAWGTRYQIIRPLNDLMKANNFDPEKNFLPGALASSTWNGKLYWFNYTGEPAVPVIAFNKTLIEKMGLSLPPEEREMAGSWTFDDLTQWAKAATKNGVWGYDKGHHAGTPVGETAELRQWGVELVDKDGKKVDFPSPQFTDWLQYRHDLIWKLKVAPQPGDDPTKLFIAGKLLALPVWPVFINMLPNTMVKDKFEVVFRLTPVLHKGDRRRSLLNEHVHGIATSRFCEHPEEAFAYLSWISGEEFAYQGVAAALSAPIARMDFWSDPRLYKLSPAMELLKDLMLNIEPDFVVANWRGEQFNTAFANDYQKLELNQLTPQEAHQQISKDCQAALDLPEA